MPVTRSQTRRGSGGPAAPSQARRQQKPKRAKPLPRKTQTKTAKVSKAPKTSPIKKNAAEEAISGSPRKISINRAPVLTLWAAVVAERQGYSFDEGLSFGRWVSGTLAQSKGKSLGIFEPHEVSEKEREERRRRDEAMGVERLDVFGMHVPAVSHEGNYQAVSQGKPLDSGSSKGYLEHSFGRDGLQAAKKAMETLAEGIPPDAIGRLAYALYEQFRPEWKGWGQKGTLDLDAVAGMVHTWQEISGHHSK